MKKEDIDIVLVAFQSLRVELLTGHVHFWIRFKKLIFFILQMYPFFLV